MSLSTAVPTVPALSVGTPVPLRLAVVDMSGTSVVEGGLQDRAFAKVVAARGLAEGTPEHERAARLFRERRGTSRTAVFQALFEDRTAALEATRAFEAAFDRLLAEHGVTAVPGAEGALVRLREAGLDLCLITGYARHTQNMILESLGWMGLADLSLSPDDAGRGVPYPDMVLTALLALDHDDVRSVLTVGDTAADILAGRRAGAGLVVGVRSGQDTGGVLAGAGADQVVDSLAQVPDLVATLRG
ncbi:HAD family hydrolase [Micrococcus porci]|uniref:HAD family hydrolase n=1 Tax=Micrococcus porci TaxID=2856555 RepID=UPI003CFA1E1B